MSDAKFRQSFRAVHGAVAACCLATGLASAQAEPVQLATEISGRGPVVVFESGLGRTHSDWSAVVPTLSRCLTTVTYDRPGLGDSPKPADPPASISAASVADQLLTLLNAKHLPNPYILVGHSLGGLYAQAFARHYPRDVAGIVLVDGSSPLEPPGVFVSKQKPEPGSIDAAEEAGMASSIVALRDGPPLPPVPLVVLAATNHELSLALEQLWQDVQRKTAQLSPKGRLQVVDSGHYVQLDKPSVVIDAVLDVAEQAGDDVGPCRTK